jgi:hypothetical protein
MIHKRTMSSRRSHRSVGLVRNGWISYASNTCIFLIVNALFNVMCAFMGKLIRCFNESRLVLMIF